MRNPTPSASKTCKINPENIIQSDTSMAFITARANELTQKYPDKKAIFDGYVCGQQNEYDDIENTIICVTWMLRKD